VCAGIVEGFENVGMWILSGLGDRSPWSGGLAQRGELGSSRTSLSEGYVEKERW